MNSVALLKALFGRDVQGEVPPDVMERVMASINPRLRKALELRLSGLTYKAVGMQIINTQTGRQGVSRERAKQLTEKALRRLRHPSRSKFLKPYLNLES